VVVTLLLVLGAAFLTDIIGINVIFGGFVCGLLIPNEGPFAGGLVDDDDVDDPWSQPMRLLPSSSGKERIALPEAATQCFFRTLLQLAAMDDDDSLTVLEEF
jgi:hypothetical protein